MGVMFVSQVINGFLLPVILVFMLILVNDKKLMGRYTNGKIYNTICVATIVFLSLLSAGYLVSLIAG